MKIHDDHMYHGAALIQVAEHPKFTAINALKTRHATHRNAYKINDEAGLFLKYCSQPKSPFDEYIFTFNADHLLELKQIAKETHHLFLGLILVADREVCCLPYSELKKLISRRKKSAKRDEDQYTILVTAPAKKSLRVYVNAPGVKKTKIGEDILVKRNGFPNTIFS